MHGALGILVIEGGVIIRAIPATPEPGSARVRLPAGPSFARTSGKESERINQSHAAPRHLTTPNDTHPHI